MNTGELVRYLERESTVEETSLLGTEHKCQGKKPAESSPSSASEETAGVMGGSLNLQHVGPSRHSDKVAEGT